MWWDMGPADACYGLCRAEWDAAGGRIVRHLYLPDGLRQIVSMATKPVAMVTDAAPVCACLVVGFPAFPPGGVVWCPLVANTGLT